MSAHEKKILRTFTCNKQEFFSLKIKKRNLQVRSELKVSKKMRVNRFNDR